MIKIEKKIFKKWLNIISLETIRPINLKVYMINLKVNGIWDLIESVSEGFLTYSCISELLCLCCVEILKNLPVHSFNALIIPILRDRLPNYFLVFL